MIKPTKWPLHPANIQISLGICPVWSESSLCAWRNIGSSATHCAHCQDFDQTGWLVLSWGGSPYLFLWTYPARIAQDPRQSTAMTLAWNEKYHKIPKIPHTKNICCNHAKIWTKVALLYSNASKICRQNGKQCRPWSDCSFRQTV